MVALRNAVQDQQLGEIEALLPWHAAGTLNVRDTRRVDEALAGDPDLARQYELICEERAETILLDESLGAPSSRAMQKLFAAIDAEPARAGVAQTVSGRLAAFFTSLSPRTLMAAASIGALALVVQAGLIGAIILQPGSPSVITRLMAPGATTESGPSVLVQFTPAARMSDIATLLDTYQATIVDGGKAGLFRLQLGHLPMSQEQVANWVDRLQHENIVSSATPALQLAK